MMRFLIASLVAFGLVASASVIVPVVATADSGYVAADAQQPTGQVDVDIDVDEGEWWANPVWIGIGLVALIALIAIIVAASRGGTTVIKD
jgi:hypothetical protein